MSAGAISTACSVAKPRAGCAGLLTGARQVATLDENVPVDEHNIWPSFGYRKNPERTEELRPDDEGDALLVGRE